MTIQSASAALTQAFECVAQTGFIPFADGILDEVSGTIKATGTARWSTLSTWADYTRYQQQLNPIRWTTPMIDVGEIKYFTLAIESDFDGDLSYRVYVSATGEFRGEETEYAIENGDYDVPAFFGRYAHVTAYVSGPELRRMTVTSNSNKNTRSLFNVNTNSLGGTSSNRTLTIDPPVSGILDMQIHVKAADAYAVNLYVSDSATSEVLIPVVKSKSSTAPSFALYGIDNDPRDGVVDITLTTLPRQAMISGNLVVIE
jgi:hypothetical protein